MILIKPLSSGVDDSDKAAFGAAEWSKPCKLSLETR